MKRILSTAILMIMLALGVPAQTAPDAGELTKLLNDFLAGASRNDVAVHDRFWAEDVIYTGSAGRRRGKADIVRDVRSAPAPKPGDPATVFTAEDIRIQQYGNTAIVAFRLVGTTRGPQRGSPAGVVAAKNGTTEVTNYLNSGTFIKRKGKWQVVNWQSTRMPRPAEEAKKEVAATEAVFHQTMLTSDVKKLESLTDESFIWTHSTGEQMTRQQLLALIGSGKLRFSKLETNNVTVSVYGDTAVVRGVSARQRSSIPASPGTGDAEPFKVFYTLTLVRRDGELKAVAMHSSRP